MLKKKTIAIMTSYYINNYGSVLQAFATKEFFSSLGLDVIFINYIRENVRHRTVVNERWNSNFVKKIIYKVYKYVDYKSKNKVFKGFVENHLKLSEAYESKEDLCDELVDADIYCVGSDQMWNSEYNGGVIDENFLRFVPIGKKKISLSTSMGMSSFSESEMKQMKALLEDFSFISVREKEAVEILDSMGIKDVYQLLDPTLLISGNKWRELCEVKENDKRYVLIYQLNDNQDMQNFAKRLAERNDLEVRQITYYMSQHWDGIKSIYNPKVEDFVSLIANAEYIVTDSFHGTAFSINLNKEFFSFSPGKYVGRISSILSLTGLENRFVEKWDQYAMPQKIDYELTEDILDKCRREARRLLKEVIK